MGLIAHYRLDGNLSDALGKYDLQAYSNSGHILPTTDAIMGQAYYRPTVNNSPAYFATTQTLHLAGSHTLACWAKVTGVHSGTANGLVSYHSHADNTGSGITVREISGSDYRISCNTGTGGSRTYNTYYGTSNIKDKWCHLVFRFDALENKISLWVDGQKEFETTYALVTRPDIIAIFAWSTTYLGGAAYRPAAYIDDVRVYDHALSEREIRDIAQAMVLHYDFNQFQEPTVNVITNTDLGTGWSTDYNKNILWGDFPPPYGVDSRVVSFVDSDGNGSGYWYCYGDYAPQNPNTTYTVSVYARTVGADWSINAYTADNSETGRQTTNTVVVPGDGNWHRIVFDPFTTPSNTTSDSLSFTFPTIPANQRCWLCAPQMEAKPYATPFVNGTRTGIIRDSSSQGNDSPLALATTPKWVEGGVVGNGCYVLEIGKYISLPKSTLGNLSSCTISFWRKRTETGSWIVGNDGNPTSGNYFMATSAGTGAFYHSSVGSPIIYCDGVLSTTPADDDEWHHYCMVGADLSAWTRLNINAYDISTGTWLFRGLIDDLRIYATALSADEVKELYQQRASIDSQGNLIC